MKYFIFILCAVFCSSCSQKKKLSNDETVSKSSKESLNYFKAEGGYVIKLNNGGIITIGEEGDLQSLSYEINKLSFFIESDGKYLFSDNREGNVVLLQNDDQHLLPEKCYFNKKTYKIKIQEE